MDLFAFCHFTLILVSALLLITPAGVLGTTFTFVNRCQYTVWPGILANAGSPKLDSTGFELPKDTTRSFLAPTGWSGRFWGRTGCNFDGSGSGSCLTGDCGSGEVECKGAGAAPPATLAEFTLGTGGQDFYDVSLVDGYNLPMIVEGAGGSGQCASTGCTSDLNQQCPSELKAGDGTACKSACEAFGSPEYCCSGAYGSPATCRPSIYSAMFKSACPRSYSYAYDDATSTFTCAGADYTLTFCPSSPSQKSSRDTPMTPTTTTPSTPQYPTTTPSTPQEPTTTTATQSGGTGMVTGTDPGLGYSGYSFAGVGSGSGIMSDSGSGSGSGIMTESGSGSGDAMLADGSYLAGLAMGGSPRRVSIFTLQSVLVCSASFLLILLFP